MEGLIVICILGVILFAFKVFLDKSAEEEPKEKIAQQVSKTKEECKSLVVRSLKSGEGLVSQNQDLVIDDNCRDVWGRVPNDITELLHRCGQIRWESGGGVGGKIAFFRSSKLASEKFRNDSRYACGLLIGTDENEFLVCMPNDEKIYSFDTFLERVDSYSNIYELLVVSAHLEDGEL